MQDSDKLAIAAHLHVLLRRKTGRVTDTEWMAVNAEYAMEVVRFARQHALEDGLPELADWADRLDQAVHAPAPTPQRRPLLESASQAVRQRLEPVAEIPRYVGGIR